MSSEWSDDWADRGDRYEPVRISGKTWRTPVTDLAGKSSGAARAERSWYKRGDYYAMEGVGGREYYEVVDARLPLTRLFVGEQEWMIDDPLHWHGMRERVEDLPPGRVLVAGLGLGLMLHHMARRTDLTKIVVVEREPDVVDLVTPTLPDDRRVTIEVEDFNDYARAEAPSFDSVLWDLAVGERRDTADQLRVGRETVQTFLPGVPLYAFGVRGRGPVPPRGRSYW